MRTTTGCVIVGLMGLGCGSEPVEEPYAPRLCETEGPIRLLDVESPVGAAWTLQSLGDQLVARWYADGEGDGARFGAYVVDRCGGGVVELPQDVTPYAVDEVLWGCNVQTGSLARLDPQTGAVGEPEPGTFDCTMRSRYENVAFLADGANERLVMLTPDGPSVLDLEVDSDGGDDPPDFPYLRSGFGFSATESPGELVWSEGDRHYRIGVASGSVAALEDLPAHLYRIAYDQILASVSDLRDTGTHETTILDENFRPVGPGPTIEGPIVWVWPPLMASEDQLYSLLEGTTHPAPRHLDDSKNLRATGDWLVYSPQGEGYHEVRDYRSGTLWYVLGPDLHEPVPPTFSSVDGALEVQRHDGAPHYRDRVVEVVDPQTGAVDEVLRFSKDLVFQRLADRRGGLLLAPQTSQGPVSVEYVDSNTFEITQLTPEADAVATVALFELVFDDDLYFVRYSGEDAGLWRTRLPPG